MNQDESDFMSPEQDQLIEGLSELEELRERGLDSSRQMPAIHHLMDELDSYVRVLQVGEPSRGLEIIREPECEQAVRGIALASLDHALSERAEQSSGSSSFTPGQMIGAYELLEPIGQGGMGTVYRARHQKLNQEVALKVLPSWKMRNPKSIARFEREMRAVGKLNHPGIVKALDAGEAEGVHFLAMELVDGVNLSELLKQSGTLAVSDACEIIRQVAEALQYIHDQGLIHRDIKPSNLMLTRDGQMKILDLGLAQMTGGLDDEELTRTGQVMGTIDYMAPEQATDSGAVDHRADIYSLGVTFYKLLAGVTPYQNEWYANPWKKIRAILEEAPPDIILTLPELPTEIAKDLDRMLAKDPDCRIQEPREVAKIVEPYCQDASLRQLGQLKIKSDFVEQQPGLGHSQKKSRAFSQKVLITLLVGIFATVAVIGWNHSKNSSSQSYSSSDLDKTVISPVNHLRKIPKLESGVPTPAMMPGYFQITPFPGSQAIGIHGLIEVDGLPVAFGRSLDHTSKVGWGYLWDPRQGIRKLEKSGFIGLNCISASEDLRRIFCTWTSPKSRRPFQGTAVWKEEEQDFFPLADAEFRPGGFADETGELLGSYRQKDGRFNLVKINPEIDLDKPGHITSLPGVEFEAGNEVSVVGTDDEGGTLVIYCRKTPFQPQEKFCLWSERTGLIDAPEVFQNGGSIQYITHNGRYLAGFTKEPKGVIYDLFTQNARLVPQHEFSKCTWVSEDGLMALGLAERGWGWIWSPEYPDTAFLSNIVQSDQETTTTLPLKHPYTFSRSGNYLCGIDTYEDEKQDGWVLDASLLKADLSQHFEFDE